MDISFQLINTHQGIISFNILHLLGKGFSFKTLFGSLGRSIPNFCESQNKKQISPYAPSTLLL